MEVTIWKSSIMGNIKTSTDKSKLCSARDGRKKKGRKGIRIHWSRPNWNLENEWYMENVLKTRSLETFRDWWKVYGHRTQQSLSLTLWESSLPTSLSPTAMPSTSSSLDQSNSSSHCQHLVSLWPPWLDSCKCFQLPLILLSTLLPEWSLKGTMNHTLLTSLNSFTGCPIFRHRRPFKWAHTYFYIFSSFQPWLSTFKTFIICLTKSSGFPK